MPETPAPITMTSASRAAPDPPTFETSCSVAMFVTLLCSGRSPAVRPVPVTIRASDAVSPKRRPEGVRARQAASRTATLGRSRAAKRGHSMGTAAISADSHIVEPPGCYVDHIDAKWRDVAPRVEKNDKGVDAYVIDGLANPIPIGLLAAAGIPSSELIAARRHSFDEINPAAFDADARIAIQDEEDIAGELIYASIGMVLCAHPDYSYKTACMAAYNRWLAGFCARHPRRLLRLGPTAVESVDQTIKDMETAKSLALVGMMMTGTPQHKDYDLPDYD